VLLFEDLAGRTPRERRAEIGVRWVRLVTDLPTGALEIARRRLSVRGYLRTLADADVESVFSRDDPLPGLLELALVPYLVGKRGY
jgi:predicted ATP-grasp superfamily ATP-dependent carboligase